MAMEKCPTPDVDHVTSELAELLAQFSDEEIAMGVVAGTVVSPEDRLTIEMVLDLLNDALRRRSGA